MASYRFLPGNRVQVVIRIKGHPGQAPTYDLPPDFKPRPNKAGKVLPPKDIVDKAMAIERELRNSKPDPAKVSGPAASDMAMADAIDRFLRERAASTDPLNATQRGIYKRMKEQFAKDTLRSMKPTPYREWMLSLGIKGQTMHKYISAINVLYSHATYGWEVPDLVSPGAGMRKRLRMTGQDMSRIKRKRRPSPEELDALTLYFSARKGTVPWLHLLEFAQETSMRLGEFCRRKDKHGWMSGLRWADLDKKAHVITIRKRKHPTKREQNNQVVPLSPRAYEIIMAQPHPEGAEFIFPYSAKSISVEFSKATRELGIVDLRLHDFRHEATSRMFEVKGMNVAQVALRTGHLNWNELTTYTHLDPKKAAAEEWAAA